MKVKELIEELKKFDPELTINRPRYPKLGESLDSSETNVEEITGRMFLMEYVDDTMTPVDSFVMFNVLN